MNSCSVHTYTQTHTYQSLVWADFITCIRLAPYAKIYFFQTLKSYPLIIIFFCRFAKNIKPSFNAKSEKELLPERCRVVHQALTSKWLSRVTGFWSGVGSGVWGQGDGTLRHTLKHTDSLPNVGEIRCYDENGNIFQVNVHAPKWRFLPGHVETTETADLRNTTSDLEFAYQSWGEKLCIWLKNKIQ